MCKTYDAIYEILEHVESNILICNTDQLSYEGTLHKCCDIEDCRCLDGIITLKDAIITCHKSGERKEFKWINISSKHIQSFSFKCCEK